MQRRDVAATLYRRCSGVVCLLGNFKVMGRKIVVQSMNNERGKMMYAIDLPTDIRQNKFNLYHSQGKYSRGKFDDMFS